MQLKPDSDAIVLALDGNAIWDAQQGIFRIPLHGSPDFAAIAILKDAPLPLAHLDASEHDRKTPLGDDLHQRLEGEVKAAIARGGQQVATGITLLTHEQMKTL